MKMKITVLIAAFFVCFIANAQPKKEAAVAKAVETLRLAMVSGNAEDLKSISSAQLTYGHSGGSIENQQEFVEKIASGKSDFVSIDLKNQTITIQKNVAIVRHELYAKTNDKGVAGEVKLKVMTVWVLENKSWKMLARQAVKMT